MIRLDVHTHDSDEPTTVDVSMYTTLKWERKFHRSAPVQLRKDAISVEYMYELAWLELDSPGGDKGFDEWCTTHDVWYADPTRDASDEDAGSGEETVDPTRPAVTTESSSNSRARRASRSGSGDTNSAKTNG